MSLISQRLTCTLIFFLFTIIVSAKDLSVTTLDGKPSVMSEHLSRDTWTLVMVWTTYCGECAKQYDEISDLHEKNKLSRLRVLGVSVDGLDKRLHVHRYAKNKNHSFPSILADSQNFSRKYFEFTDESFNGTPTYLLFDKTKVLQAYMDGPITTKALARFINDFNLTKN